MLLFDAIADSPFLVAVRCSDQTPIAVTSNLLSPVAVAASLLSRVAVIYCYHL